MKQKSPYLIIVLSFVLLILIGTILLYLPISQTNNDISFLDAYFLSTSAVTITGLSPLSNLSESLTLFGKIVLILLVQLGGLSIITISVFVMLLLGLKIGIKDRFLIKESLNQNSLKGLVKLVKKIVLTSLTIEFIGALINLIVFIPNHKLGDAILFSVFHSISSFNNAGFDILGNSSLINYHNNILLNINTALLIMLGGFGFIVLFDIFKQRSYKKLSVHSKIVIKVNLILWVIAPIIFKLTSNITWLESFFLSVTSRTAGFTTINLGLLPSATLLIVMMLMFIGASPSSTGGGVKTTTFYILIKKVLGFARGKRVITNKRLINEKSVWRAFILVVLSGTLVLVGTFLLLIFDNKGLEVSLFEVISAFGNVGLTINLTLLLSMGSKIVLAIIMLIGRVGPLTFILMLNKNWNQDETEKIDYLEEKIIIG